MGLTCKSSMAMRLAFLRATSRTLSRSSFSTCFTFSLLSRAWCRDSSFSAFSSSLRRRRSSRSASVSGPLHELCSEPRSLSSPGHAPREVLLHQSPLLATNVVSVICSLRSFCVNGNISDSEVIALTW